MNRITLATERYAFNHVPALMAAKLLSMKTGMPLMIRNSSYLVRLGLEPYVPSFIVETETGSTIVLRTGCSSRHWDVMRQLENALGELGFT